MSVKFTSKSHDKQKGADVVFADLYDCYYARFVHYANGFVTDFDVCRDIVQELFVKVWERKLYELNQTEFEKYLYRSIKNACIDHLRKEKSNPSTSLTILQALIQQSEESVSEMEMKELVDKIKTQFDQLPEKTALVFKKSRLGGMSNADIAEDLNLSVKGVEFHITKARKYLALALKEYMPLLIVLLGN
ncbi:MULTISPECIES: RNA polymerase sigma-70 factor [unclassified Carboxylicivirga]|uniref:RNA polymerase sigma-70 factor n=1 Tax=Carboxylicivirga TaxID=1628153 RepID=UPI003D344206